MKFLRSLRECIRYPARATKLAFGFMSMATLIAAMVACFIFHYVENESILNFALAWSFNRTQWSERYSQRAYKSVSFGFGREEVVRSIGEPLEKQIYPEGEIWHYACAKVANRCRYFSKPYHRRDISFDKSGFVQNMVRVLD